MGTPRGPLNVAKGLALLAVAVLLAVACSGGGEKAVPLEKRWLAFALSDGVYLARADGSGRKRLTRIREFEYQPDWSPDAKKLLLRVDAAEGRRGGGVHLVTLGREGAVNLSTVSGVFGGDPDWSPDGERIAFVGKRKPEARFGLYVMNADGSRPKRLTSDAWEAQYPDWSPDGRKIVFTGVRNFGFDLYVIDVDGSNVRRLTQTPEEENWPTWSPDAEKIVYAFGNGLRVMDADGANSTVLTEAGGEPSWSQDGRWIAFDCGTAEKGRMCAIRPDGTGRTRILPGFDGGFPAWRPTG
jgi:Tol biopolymer transport system component